MKNCILATRAALLVSLALSGAASAQEAASDQAAGDLTTQAVCSYYLTLMAPAAGANYTAPANITFRADADGTADGCTVLQVKFYNGTTLLAQVSRGTDGMFSYTWSG